MRRRRVALLAAAFALAGCTSPPQTPSSPTAGAAAAAAPAPSASAPAVPFVERLRAMGLQTLTAQGEHSLPTQFAPGHATRAEQHRALIEAARRFYAAQLGLQPPLHLAVLDRERWARAIPWQPYGIPGVAGRPPVVFMPADDSGLAAEDALALRDGAAPATLAHLARAGWSYDEAARRYVDLVGLHELGHAYATAHGFRAPSPWLNEFAASYWAYAFLQRERPREAAMWEGVLRAYLDAVKPSHRTLADFDRLYFGVGARNYVWFQAQFQRRIEQVHAAQGLGFLEALRRVFPAGQAAPAPEEVLRRLEAIEPGWLAWVSAMEAGQAP